MEKVNIEEYQEYIEKKDYDSIKDNILEKIVKLAYDILSKKNIDFYNYEDEECKIYKLDKNANDEKKYFKLERLFDYDIYICTDIAYLIKWLTTNYDRRDIEKSNVESWIRLYNEMVEEYDNYLEYRSYVEKRDSKEIFKEYREKIEKLLKEMLDYKKKPYREDIRLNDLFKKCELYYAYYIMYLDDLQRALGGWSRNEFMYNVPSKTLDITEKYMKIEYLYNYLKNNYKENAFIYRDFDLEDGEEISDLIGKQIHKFDSLCKEMLEFLNVEYDDEATPHQIKCQMLDYYPYYKELIDEAEKRRVGFDPTIALLSRMEDVYDKIKATYKNHDEDIKKYIPPKKEEDTNVDDLYIDEEDEIEWK